MAPRKPIPPPIKCRGTARHTGERCKRWAIPGSTVCKHHGGYAGRGGRARAEELHTVRRLEAVVTQAASEVMLEMGYPAEIVEAAGGVAPTGPGQGHRSDLEGGRQTQREDSAATRTALGRLAASLIEAFPAAPPTIDGQAVPERDQVAEDIERLEARPTPKRQAEAARLQQTHARGLTRHGQVEEPEVVDAELADEPEPERQPSRIFDPVRRIYVRNPNYVRRASSSSGVTTLGYRGGEPTVPTTRLSY